MLINMDNVVVNTMISLDILKRLYLKLLKRIVLLSLYCVLLFTEAYERFRSGLINDPALSNQPLYQRRVVFIDCRPR